MPEPSTKIGPFVDSMRHPKLSLIDRPKQRRIFRAVLSGRLYYCRQLKRYGSGLASGAKTDVTEDVMACIDELENVSQTAKDEILNALGLKRLGQ